MLCKRIASVMTAFLILPLIITGCTPSQSYPTEPTSNFEASFQPADPLTSSHPKFRVTVTKWDKDKSSQDSVFIVMTTTNPNAKVYLDGGWSYDGSTGGFGVQTSESNAVNVAFQERKLSPLIVNHINTMNMVGPGKVLVQAGSTMPIPSADWRMAIVDLYAPNNRLDVYIVRWIKVIPPSNTTVAAQDGHTLPESSLTLPSEEILTSNPPPSSGLWKDLVIGLTTYSQPNPRLKDLDIIGLNSTILSCSTISTPAGSATLLLSQAQNSYYVYWVIVHRANYASAISAAVVTGDAKSAKNEVMELVKGWNVPK